MKFPSRDTSRDKIDLNFEISPPQASVYPNSFIDLSQINEEHVSPYKAEGPLTTTSIIQISQISPS